MQLERPLSVESAKAIANLVAGQADHRLGEMFKQLMRKKIRIDRVAALIKRTDHLPGKYRWNVSRVRHQTNRTADALGRPTIAGEPRKLYPKAIRDAATNACIQLEQELDVR